MSHDRVILVLPDGDEVDLGSVNEFLEQDNDDSLESIFQDIVSEMAMGDYDQEVTLKLKLQVKG